MNTAWGRLVVWLDGLAPRERIGVLLAAIAVVVFGINALLIAPDMARRKALVSQLDQQRAALATLQPRIAALERALAEPEAAHRERQNAMRREIVQIDETLKGMQQRLVPAERMNSVLQDVLAHNANLRLVSLRTLPVTTLVVTSAKTDGSSAPEGAVFKHGVQISVEGSYGDLHDYLQRLERLPAQMFWLRSSLTADHTPRLVLTITLYTLSLDKAWLVV